MPTLKFESGSFSNYSDGSGTVRFLCDLSSELSAMYGKLIRQGSVFKINGIQVRLQNPNTLAQDNSLSAAGRIAYYHPTGNRKKAWRNGFSAVQRLRRQHGLKESGYDFRVALYEISGWDQVDYQAWVKGENDLLVLGNNPSDPERSLFNVHNSALDTVTSPRDTGTSGFGTPYDTPGILPQDVDFHENDNGYFTPGRADIDLQEVGFQVAAAGSFDDFGSGGDYAGWTNAQQINGPIWAMCGLLGVEVDTTIPDDSETQTQDSEIHLYVDVESWTPIVKKKKGRKSRGRRKGRK